jgi:hypothetical protein
MSFLVTGALVLAAAGAKALSVAEEGQAKDVAQPSQLARDLVGTWILAGTPDRFDDPPPAKGPLKFFTGKYWTFTQADPPTGKVVYHHGGTYTLDGDNYAEAVQYANENTTAMIGQTLKFKLKINGDTLVQVGVGNSFSQVWKRAK